MAEKQLGGFALIAEVVNTTEDGASDPRILLFYAAPNPVPAGVPFKLYWTTSDVDQVRIFGPRGFDSGILTASVDGFFTKDGGISSDSIFTLTALDANGDPLLMNGLQVANNIRVVVQ